VRRASADLSPLKHSDRHAALASAPRDREADDSAPDHHDVGCLGVLGH
jgi:hypothetical protein